MDHNNFLAYWHDAPYSVVFRNRWKEMVMFFLSLCVCWPSPLPGSSLSSFISAPLFINLDVFSGWCFDLCFPLLAVSVLYTQAPRYPSRVMCGFTWLLYFHPLNWNLQRCLLYSALLLFSE